MHLRVIKEQEQKLVVSQSQGYVSERSRLSYTTELELNNHSSWCLIKQALPSSNVSYHFFKCNHVHIVDGILGRYAIDRFNSVTTVTNQDLGFQRHMSCLSLCSMIVGTTWLFGLLILMELLTITFYSEFISLSSVIQAITQPFLLTRVFYILTITLTLTLNLTLTGNSTHRNKSTLTYICRTTCTSLSGRMKIISSWTEYY